MRPFILHLPAPLSLSPGSYQVVITFLPSGGPPRDVGNEPAPGRQMNHPHAVQRPQSPARSPPHGPGCSHPGTAGTAGPGR